MSALQSHCSAETETTPSKVPALKGRPCPMSCCIRSPSIPRSAATSSIEGAMSHPTHMCPSSVNSSPDKPAHETDTNEMNNVQKAKERRGNKNGRRAQCSKPSNRFGKNNRPPSSGSRYQVLTGPATDIQKVCHSNVFWEVEQFNASPSQLVLNLDHPCVGLGEVI